MRSFGDVSASQKGGFIEKEENLLHEGNAWVFDNAHVYGDALVSGDARVFGNARLKAKRRYVKGRFVGGIDGEDIVTNITSQTGTDYWDNLS